MHSSSSLSIALRHTQASHVHTHVHTQTQWHAQGLYLGHPGMHLFFESTVFSFQRPSALGSACLFFPGEDALTFRSTIPLQSLEGTFFSPVKEDGGWGGQFWVAVLSDTEGLKKTELEILKNLEHVEMSHSHREEHTLGNFLPCLTINTQK